MNKLKSIFLLMIIIYIVLLIFSPYPRYLFYFPSFYFYSNKKEADLVYKLTTERTYENEQIFYITDKFISNLFSNYVKEDKTILDKYITEPKVIFVILFLSLICARKTSPFSSIKDKSALACNANTPTLFTMVTYPVLATKSAEVRLAVTGNTEYITLV